MPKFLLRSDDFVPPQTRPADCHSIWISGLSSARVWMAPMLLRCHLKNCTSDWQVHRMNWCLSVTLVLEILRVQLRELDWSRNHSHWWGGLWRLLPVCCKQCLDIQCDDGLAASCDEFSNFSCHFVRGVTIKQSVLFAPLAFNCECWWCHCSWL